MILQFHLPLISFAQAIKYIVDGNEGKASLLFTVFKRDLDSSQNMKTLVIHSKNEKNIISGKEKPKLYTFYIPDFNKKYKNGVFTELDSYGCIENIESNEMFYNVLGECVYGKWKSRNGCSYSSYCLS